MGWANSPATKVWRELTGGEGQTSYIAIFLAFSLHPRGEGSMPPTTISRSTRASPARSSSGGRPRTCMEAVCSLRPSVPYSRPLTLIVKVIFRCDLRRLPGERIECPEVGRGKLGKSSTREPLRAGKESPCRCAAP
jgi:hypothetical protein